jgi:glucokinase
MIILAGDIGGTNTRLAIFEVEDERPKVILEQTYRSKEHGNLEEIVSQFLTQSGANVKAACFGVAGPVRDGRARTANLPWVIDASELARLTGSAPVTLINDLEANAYGLDGLDSDDFVLLNEGAPDVRGNEAIISAGTGLGEAGLRFEAGKRRPFATEGGHADFAPRDELQIDLLRFLMAETPHVSCERVLSGPGLLNIYRFLRDTKRFAEPAWLAEQVSKKDPSAVISKMALEEESELCVQALDIFVSIYGAEAGNLALRVLATGGVFVGGGIAPKIIRKLKKSGFIETFVAKGRMRSLMEAIPVRVIMNDKTALLGAALRAAS